MEKYTKRIDIDLEMDFDCEYDDAPVILDSVIEFFNAAKKSGATHVKWSGEPNHEGGVYVCTAQPIKYQTESDEEFQERIDAQKVKTRIQVQINERAERATLAQLKDKYEK